MKQTLKVQIAGKREYDIDITDVGFEAFMRDIDSYTQGKKRLIVISKKVYKLYSKLLKLDMDELLIFPDGEKEKNYKNYIKILEYALKRGLTRKDVIIALGGGVVGDIAGFAASTYMRGIDFIQVPTTLLSAVDSSVGGKTAIDLKDAKNIAGTFYQPKKVFININFLKTLDKRQFLSGMGEVLKYAYIEDSCNLDVKLFLFEFLTLGVEKILSKEPITLIRLIEYCLKLKIAVVNQDEKEGGLRKILNFGHTYAHALETITKYRKYTHGEAVVYGMFFIFDWAYKNGLITYSYYKLSVELLEKYGFSPLKTSYPIDKIVEIMKKDKKAANGKVTFIVPTEKKQVAERSFTPFEVEQMF
jgi:3-dehydroquinate synthase